MRVAIVGGGISGLAAAYALAGRASVTVLEAADRMGGHVVTVPAATPRGEVAVDMGFIVCNRERYPHFFTMLDALGVATRATSMSFSVALPELGVEWGSASLGAVFADRRRLVDRRHWRFFLAVLGFLQAARRDLRAGACGERSLDEYLEAQRVPAEVRDGFIVPLAAALWSLAPARCGAFPAESYLRFLEQHGMLRAARPLPWRTIVGGSQRYLDALLPCLAAAGVALCPSSPVARLHRDRLGVTALVGGEELRFDRAIVATPADLALALLAEPSDAERRVLGAFSYSRNRTVLHSDASFLPRNPRAHASWNYVSDRDASRVAVTYSMNRLQGLPADPPLLVTLNPRRPIAAGLARAEVELRHPQFDLAALRAQRALRAGLGSGRVYFAGAHLGFGFHEDGARSGIAAAAALLRDADQGSIAERAS